MRGREGGSCLRCFVCDFVKLQTIPLLARSNAANGAGLSLACCLVSRALLD